jgi:hypothetical protein
MCNVPVDGLLFVSVGRAVGPATTPPSAGTPATLVVGGSCNGRSGGRWLLASGGRTVLAAAPSRGRRRHHQLLLTRHHHVAHVHLSFFLFLSLLFGAPTRHESVVEFVMKRADQVQLLPSLGDSQFFLASDGKKKENEILGLVLPSFLWVRGS